MTRRTPATAQQALETTLKKLEKHIPNFRKKWMLWGTSAVAADVIRPQTGIPLVSIDLDFRSRTASMPIHKELAGIKRAFPGHKIVQSDMEFGLLRTIVKDEATGLEVSIDLMTSDDETANEKPALSASFHNFPTQTIESYTRNKIACLTDRLEEKDLLHLFFLKQASPEQKRVIDHGVRKVPLSVLVGHRIALNENWKALIKICVWGKLPAAAGLDELNQWLQVIQVQIEAGTHGANRHKKKG